MRRWNFFSLFPCFPFKENVLNFSSPAADIYKKNRQKKPIYLNKKLNKPFLEFHRPCREYSAEPVFVGSLGLTMQSSSIQYQNPQCLVPCIVKVHFSAVYHYHIEKETSRTPPPSPPSALGTWEPATNSVGMPRKIWDMSSGK